MQAMTNVVLSGASGFVGSEVLRQLLSHPEVAKVTCLTRRALPDVHAKLVTRIVPDFTRYEPALLDELADHAACIWALGGKASDFEDLGLFAKVTHDYAVAFADAFAAHGEGTKTFCYMSGMGADREPANRLRWEHATRRYKGLTERDLVALQNRYPRLRVRCFRPGGILPRNATTWYEDLLGRYVIRVDTVARALIACALAPDEFSDPVSNLELVRAASGRG
jgi:nucleoside-diphosphate-sugar epimerase